MTEKITVIVSEGRGSEPTRQTLIRDLSAALARRADLEVSILGHLYDLLPDGPSMQLLQSVDGDMIVLCSLYPRAAFWALDANSIRGRMGCTSFFPEDELDTTRTGPVDQGDGRPDRTIWCVDLRPHSEVEPLLAEIERIASEATGETVEVDAGREPIARGEGRVEEATQYRWYPVLDYGRCTNCLECLNFCLFGVFELDESGQILVEQPDACRDGCPACSRVCPSRAIMFPHHHTPAVAGDHTATDDGFNLDLVQLAGLAGPGQLVPNQLAPGQLAEAERDRALAEKAKADQSDGGRGNEKDDLDRLVDELDQVDL